MRLVPPVGHCSLYIWVLKKGNIGAPLRKILIPLCLQNIPGVSKNGGLANAAVNVEFRTNISNPLENRNPYVRAKYRTISERYQGAYT